MLDKLQENMRESIKLVDSLYVELLTNGLRSETSKNKLINMYERMLQINVTVIKNSVDTEELAGQLICYYCDLCHATSSLFSYYRQLNNRGGLIDKELASSIDDKINTLNSKIEALESELYQRDLDIEELERQLEARDELLITRFIKEEYRERFKKIRSTWKMDKELINKQLAEKDSIIEKLRKELDNSKKRIKELEAVDKLHSKENPAKRIDVDDNVLIELYLNGNSPYKIGKMFNMSQTAVIYRLKTAGVYVTGGRDKRAKNSPAVNK